MARILLVLSLAALVAACGGGEAETQQSGLQPLGTLTGGEQLPDAELPRLDGGGVLATADLRGRPTLLNFWATWCVFCVEEMPALEDVHQDVADEVRFVGIDREDNHDKARRLAAETGVTYELVVDDDGSFFRAVQARGMPTTVFVDADGVIVYRHAGPLTADQLRGLLEEHLDVGG
ncbi:MAG: TlpA family protein disulfide reductase [Nitriliruptorales bacterium]